MKEHSQSRRVSTAIILIIFGIIFTVITIVSIYNGNPVLDIIFNILSTIICFGISFVLLRKTKK